MDNKQSLNTNYTLSGNNSVESMYMNMNMKDIASMIPQLNMPSYDYLANISNPVEETNKLLEANNKSTQRSEYELNKINAQFKSLNIEIDKHNETIKNLECEVTSLKTSLAKLENPNYWKKSIAITFGCGLILLIINVVANLFT